MSKFYITTSIPYVNAAPHIGHALEFVQTDIIARYNRLLGNEVTLTTGADENSLKNVQSAEALGMKTADLCAQNAKLFRNLADRIWLSYDSFVRSSIKEEHWAGVEEIWRRCSDAGDIYKKKYRGIYCVGCELFYKETELVDGKCPVHLSVPETVEEENYFFRLSKYQKQIEDLIGSGKLRIYPETRKNEMLNFVKEGLEDFSISRSEKRAHGWGVPVPGDNTQRIYVWFDALTVYLSGVGYGKNEKEFEGWWPADVHVIGKDIIRFHSIYWPAMLLSAKLALPRTLFVHGFLTIEGRKMSKSLGNVIDPLKLIEKYTADGLRYYFIRDAPNFYDSDFTMAGIRDRYDNELLGDLGNLVNRVLTIAEKTKKSEFSGTMELPKLLKFAEIKMKMDNLELHEALDTAMAFVRECNAYVNRREPWKLKGAELDDALYNLLESIRISAVVLQPFIPSTSKRIAEMLGVSINGIDDCAPRQKFSGRISRGELLFPKLD